MIRQNEARYQSHRYWLMITLVISFTALLLVDLFTLTGHINQTEHTLLQVLMRLCFVYLVITSLFRLFDNTPVKAGSAQKADPALLADIDSTMRAQKIYRKMNVNREQCAKALGLQEHVLSRTINQLEGQNFNEFINRYRVEEAQKRLLAESTSVTAIAFEVGFSSIASFNRVFKAMVGCSPTQYRAGKK